MFRDIKKVELDRKKSLGSCPAPSLSLTSWTLSGEWPPLQHILCNRGKQLVTEILVNLRQVDSFLLLNPLSNLSIPVPENQDSILSLQWNSVWGCSEPQTWLVSAYIPRPWHRWIMNPNPLLLQPASLPFSSQGPFSLVSQKILKKKIPLMTFLLCQSHSSASLPVISPSPELSLAIYCSSRGLSLYPHEFLPLVFLSFVGSSLPFMPIQNAWKWFETTLYKERHCETPSSPQLVFKLHASFSELLMNPGFRGFFSSIPKGIEALPDLMCWVKRGFRELLGQLCQKTGWILNWKQGQVGIPDLP